MIFSSQRKIFKAQSPDPEAESFVYNMYKKSAKQPFHTYVKYTPGIYADNGGGNSGPRTDYPPEKFGETRVAEVEKTADGWKGGVYGTGWQKLAM